MLKIVGDICLSDIHLDVGLGVGTKISNGHNPFAHLQKKEDEIWIGNFESVVATQSIYQNYHKDFFRIEPSKLEKCKFIDYFGIANNHVMEHGGVAYNQMRTFLQEFSKGAFGSEEQKTIVFNDSGKNISITGFSLRREEGKEKPLYWNMPSLSEIKEEFDNIQSDFKIAYIHWGVEFINYPSIDQRRFAHWLIDLGFDIIIGMHPHILQGYEIYKDKYIFYSIGNFIFNMSWEPTKYSIIVNIDITTNKVSFDYIKIGDDLCPRVVDEVNVPKECRMDELSSKVNIQKNIEEYISEANIGLKLYRKYSHRAFINNILQYDKRVLKGMIIDYIKRHL